MKEFNENYPIYLQIMNDIKRKMIAGILAPGEKLPAVKEMSALIMVNPNTIARSYQELDREGVAEGRRGMGTYITTDPAIFKRIRGEQSSTLVKAFVQDMKECGFLPDEIIHFVSAELKISFKNEEGE